MEMTMRWFGKDYDTVTLEQIKQTRYATGIITTLYNKMPGEVWNLDEILAMKKEVEDAGLHLAGIESVNVSDAIKTGGAGRDHDIQAYIETLENLGKADIHMVCYNFMPVFDWTRTELDLDHKIAGASDMKTAEERVKCQLTKYQMCMGCLACESVCRFNALSVKEEN